MLCSAYSETLEFDKRWASRDEMLPARDEALRIFRVDQFFGVALGVLKDIDDKTSLVAILGISGSLFDIMPTALRDHSEVLLELGEGQIIIQSPSPALLNSSSEIISVATVSERYPLRTIIRVDRHALSGWDHEPYVPIVALAALLGLAFGILLGRAVAQPGGPVVENFLHMCQRNVQRLDGRILESASSKLSCHGSSGPPRRDRAEPGRATTIASYNAPGSIKDWSDPGRRGAGHELTFWQPDRGCHAEDAS